MFRVRKTDGCRLLATLALLALAGCESAPPQATDADVIIVGAGIAGIAAALEAESLGARVLVIEANSVAGGHAVKADGFALVDTPLQRAKGLRDSPDIAYRDFVAWGEDPDPGWTQRYAGESRTEVHDWLTALGVRFTTLADTAQDTVPRLHQTRGGAVNAVVPLIRAALQRERIDFLWNTEVTGILRREGRMAGVYTRRTRNDGQRLYRAPAIVLATGGFGANLGLVRQHWRADLPVPARLLAGAGSFATGSGLALAEPFGAAVTRLDRQVTVVGGLPDPRNPDGERGLLVQNPAAIWVDATGRRFTNEAAPGRVTERAVLALSPATLWLVFDAAGARKLTVDGAAWLTPATVRRDILGNATLVKSATTIEALAESAGLPAATLADTVERFNRFVELGMDTDFGRIGPGMTEPPPARLRQPPFYAVQLYPMTRANLGGLAIDAEARVLGGASQVLHGLFAAGEATGVAGINGSHGGSGTFLGPAVLTGRVAGRGAARLVLGEAAATAPASPPDATERPRPGTAPVTLRRESGDLPALLAAARPGYWHFNVSHALLVERGQACADCHRSGWPPSPAITREQRLVQLDSCTRCH